MVALPLHAASVIGVSVLLIVTYTNYKAIRMPECLLRSLMPPSLLALSRKRERGTKTRCASAYEKACAKSTTCAAMSASLALRSIAILRSRL
jgi:hypothetical protein